MWISGFWRRIGASFIDAMVIGAIGITLGLFLKDYFVEIGIYGRLIGFGIAITYFGILNSKLGNGQTLGKKALKIRVVNSENKPISLIRSLGRYCILSVPFFLNGARFSDGIMSSFWIYIFSLVIFGGLFSVLYLYIFNRITRQSLHDLALGTYVVNVGIEKSKVGKVWSPHLIVVGLLFISAGIAPLLTSNLAKQEPFVDLIKCRKSLMENPLVNHATVSFKTNSVITSNKETTKTTYLSTQVFLRSDQISNAELANTLAKSLANNFPLVPEKDLIIINLVYGYDIGIASSWQSHSYRFNPSELVQEK